MGDYSDLVRPAHTITARIVGALLSSIGFAFWAAIAHLAYVAVENSRVATAAVIGILLGIGTVAYFCTAVGLRLLMNRPNRYGSVLSLRGWAVLGAFFGAGVASFIAIAVMHRLPSVLLVGAAPCAVLSAACYFIRAKLKQRDARAA
jgi:hypothetical protein